MTHTLTSAIVIFGLSFAATCLPKIRSLTHAPKAKKALFVGLSVTICLFSLYELTTETGLIYSILFLAVPVTSLTLIYINLFTAQTPSK